jgi:DNA polymerase-1
VPFVEISSLNDAATFAAEAAAAGEVALSLAGDGDARLLALGVPGGEPRVWSMREWKTFPPELAAALLSCRVVSHETRRNLRWLGMVFGLHLSHVFCTGSAARLLACGGEPPPSLPEMAARQGGWPAPPPEEEAWSDLFLAPGQVEAAAWPVRVLPALARALEKLLTDALLGEIATLEMELLPVVARMEATGLGVDLPRLEELWHVYRRQQAELENQLREVLQAPRINVSSPKQLLAALQARGLKISDTRDQTLSQHGQDPAVPLLQTFRSQEKLAQIAEGLRTATTRAGRIHASFDPLGTETGRFSSDSPNLQNVPRGPLRSVFRAPTGRTLVTADYSQIELRAVAVVAQDRTMLQALAQGEDLHRLTASAILDKPPTDVTKGDRQLAKSVNFGLIYGQGAKGLVVYARQKYGVDFSVEQALLFRDRFFSTYREIATWHKNAWKAAAGDVGEVRTALGRRRLLSPTASRWNRFTTIVNTPIQGGTADGLKAALVSLAAALPQGAELVSTVHDEIVVECDASQASTIEPLVREHMRSGMARAFPQVPIEVETRVSAAWG